VAKEIIVLRNQGAISSDVMLRTDRDLDLGDSRLEIQVGLFSPRGRGYRGAVWRVERCADPSLNRGE
jgi:hypothetical protein